MKIQKTLLGLCIGLTIMTQAACSKQSGEPDADTSGSVDTILTDTPGEDASEAGTGEIEKDTPAGNNAGSAQADAAGDDDLLKELETFDTLADIPELLSFINKNIRTASPENASAMLMRMEELQLEARQELEELYMPEVIQSSLQKDFLEDMDLSKLEKTQDADFSGLLKLTLDSGYRLEQAEGFFFPVLDYSVYEAYSAYAMPEVTAYLDIMAVESEQIFAKDAALIIGWDEVINRTLALELFLKTYGASDKTETIKELFQRYQSIAIYGLNNTPLFDYDTKLMAKEARKAYENAVAGSSDSAFLQMIKDFTEVAERNGYILTEEVEQFRKEALAR